MSFKNKEVHRSCGPRGTQRRFAPKYIENTFWATQSTFR